MLKTFAAIGLMLCLIACSACAAIATPNRCEHAAAGLRTAAEIAQAFIAIGVEPARAQKLADGVATGQLLLAAACAQANRPPVTVPT